jgi:16S rRNA processing protein RimM
MIVLGRITAPYGVAGWVKIHAFGDDPLAWRAMPQWWISESADAPAELWRSVKLSGCRMHGGTLLVRFEGGEDRDAAERLRGQFIGAPRAALPKTARDEYYWSDLMGLPVKNLDGEPLGSVADLIESGAHTVLQLKDEAGVERLLPFTAHVVKKVCVEGPGRGIEVDWGVLWGLE